MTKGGSGCTFHVNNVRSKDWLRNDTGCRLVGDNVIKIFKDNCHID